jgi:transcriptional regulator with XRE-family HTH domain
MNETWKTRLESAIADANTRGISNRELCRRAGVGQPFIYDVLKVGKVPSVENMEQMARALDVSVVYLLTGLQVTPELEELLSIWTALPPDRRQVLQQLVRQLKAP